MRLNDSLYSFEHVFHRLPLLITHDYNQVHLETNLSSFIIAPTWFEKYGPQIDQTFSGPLSF